MSEENQEPQAAVVAEKPMYWTIPKSFSREVRQMSKNQLRDRVLQLSISLLDYRNANLVLLERLKESEAKAAK